MPYPNRILKLFEIVAQSKNEGRATFIWFEKQLKENKDNFQNLWNEVKNLFAKIKHWFDDVEFWAQHSLNEIIEDFVNSDNFNNLPKWKQRVIQEPNLLDHSKKHYIAVPNDNSCCWLIPNTRTSNDKIGLSQCEKIY